MKPPNYLCVNQQSDSRPAIVAGDSCPVGNGSYSEMDSIWCRYLQCDSDKKQHRVTLFILGEMFGWGNTVNGELGLGGIEEEQILSPRELKFSKATQVQQVACGTNHTAVVTNDGQVYTCGNNDYSQLGHNKPRKRLEQVDGLSAYVINNVACGMAHSVAVNEWGQVFSWGSNGTPTLEPSFTRLDLTLVPTPDMYENSQLET
ncbi:unnamed protein product [Timema podura]|uniref:Regulator of chromosome condensation n=1 Tax=Timema podura TaxID=61482 RepID=A0ABN7PGY9_TIMPD|nr:unnamed protein product [Timema podura]